MENAFYSLVVSALLVYPGAIVEWIYSSFAKDTVLSTPQSGIVATVRYLFYSVFISVPSVTILVLISNRQIKTLADLPLFLAYKWNILWYLLISFVASLLFSAVWYGFMNHVLRSFLNCLKKRLGYPTDTGYLSSWEAIVKSRSFDQTTAIVFIEKNNQLISCGFIKTLPDHISKDASFSLLYTDYCMAMYLRDKELPVEENLIGNDLATYIEAQSGLKIIFRDGSTLKAQIDSYTPNTSVTS